MEIIDGRLTAEKIKNNLATEISELKKTTGRIPGLVTILVGENPASQVYVKMKNKACAKIGMHSEQLNLPKEISENELLEIIEKYNRDDNFNGILVQLPLPDHINEDKIIESISKDKDVDGFHPVSVGNLVIGKDTFYPCTPYGIFYLLKEYGIDTKGKHVVVVGRSNIVGKPIANIMLQKKEGANAIVTVCHSAAPDLKLFTRQADILIAAIGRANFITNDMVKDGVVVIDVGINRINDSSSAKGYKIVGDVDFDEVSKKASYITPVPGGVGPMTIAMLLQNTFKAFKRVVK
ncbi:MAG: bifunctional methylenetetrahydrofolate dehydrogenase/methenyltetrahydrofolate cyclohydrolase FolD [Melioribacteraceae bacterium]|nr:bifunctional methylenetetrahydrofolate dehydrogenase/methenyltetrahydrofolate cyclohydrolase FolD [Melioribacteraceae bacterium]MCF8263799.1 bifunctional methylenetetrahydrofolate dehydrogenase/methenyltetrahydrofolate cyclohydrolase FolD [Melioribacteraceae bacterium]MCF8412114.1 bifunctional methylenetetrahydrofolate dehydrogenase/methenyltetrahydrofolate cyclohydrolase FolD [Melioribacteraceae bacterium]